MYCPGHAGVKGNDRADRRASKATLTSGLFLGRSEVLKSLRLYLWAQSQGHHTIDRLEERGVERGSARRSSLKGRERPSSIRPVSKAPLGKRPRDGVERIWVFRAHRYHLELKCKTYPNRPDGHRCLEARNNSKYLSYPKSDLQTQPE